MSAVSIAAGLIRRFEGFRSVPYLCPAGIPTIGYGFTRHPNGRPVTLQDLPMLRADAELRLAEILGRDIEHAVRALCGGPQDDRRLAALIDFAYNLGTGTLRASTLGRKVKAGDWPGACQELSRWIHAGKSVTLGGLIKRRAAEIALITETLAK